MAAFDINIKKLTCFATPEPLLFDQTVWEQLRTMEIQGKHNTAKIFTENIDEESLSQLYNMLNIPCFSEGWVRYWKRQRQPELELLSAPRGRPVT
jgi:hypothetical protein